MDPNLLSMIWWGIPALAGFALIATSLVVALWLALRRRGSEACVYALLLIFVVGNFVAWPCNYKAHEYSRLWLGAEPVAEASGEEGR